VKPGTQILQDGPGISTIGVGDRVAVSLLNGGFAERIVAPEMGKIQHRGSIQFTESFLRRRLPNWSNHQAKSSEPRGSHSPRVRCARSCQRDALLDEPICDFDADLFKRQLRETAEPGDFGSLRLLFLVVAIFRRWRAIEFFEPSSRRVPIREPRFAHPVNRSREGGDRRHRVRFR